MAVGRVGWLLVGGWWWFADLKSEWCICGGEMLNNDNNTEIMSFDRGQRHSYFRCLIHFSSNAKLC